MKPPQTLKRISIYLFVSIFLFLNNGFILAKTIHKEQSLYRNILVTQINQRRCMSFSLRKDREQNQSCFLLNAPQQLVFDYTKLSLVGAFSKPHANNILIIGLGGGSLVNAYHYLLPEAKITSVEIDPAVIKVAKKYFFLPTQSWHTIVAKDARLFVKRALIKKQSFDLIILDAFNGDYIPEHLMTREFFSEVRKLLDEQGAVVSNTFATSQLYHSESATYAAVFGNYIELKGEYSGNRVILAHKNKRFSKQQIRQNMKKFAQKLQKIGLSPNYLLNALNTKPRWNSNARILTDDYAPVNILNH